MKKVLSVLIVLALAMSLFGCFKVNIVLPDAASGNNASKTVDVVTEYPEVNAPTSDGTFVQPSSNEPSSLPPVIAPTQSEAISEPVSAAAPVSEAPASQAPASEAPVSQAPAAKQINEMSKEEIVAFFNSTLNAVKTEKMGFKKSKLTSILDLKLSNSAANTLVGLVKNALLSETAEETTVKKGQSSNDVMSPSGASFVSNITPADVSSFKVTKSGTNFVINIGIKDMTNPDKSSAYGRIFDFMTVEDVVNIYAPKVGATVAREDIVVDFRGCYAELTVNADNKVVSYTTYVKGIMNMNNAKVKKVVTIDTDVAVTLGSTTNYTNFAY